MEKINREKVEMFLSILDRAIDDLEHKIIVIPDERITDLVAVFKLKNKEYVPIIEQLGKPILIKRRKKKNDRRT